jgi:hypothetical protein
MTVVSRLGYAAALLVISYAVLLLLFAGLEASGAASDVQFEDVASHPAYFLAVLCVGFLVAPRLSRRLPVAGEPAQAPTGGKPGMRYEIRIVLFAILAMILSIAASLVAMAFA